MNKELFDLVAGQPAPDVTLVWPALRYALEPLTGFSEYILSFTRYIVQLVSWLAWLCAATAVWAFLRKKTVKEAAVQILGVWLVFLTAVVVVLLFPLPGPRLAPPPGVAAMDFHGHTYYSHDAVKSPAQNVAFHRRLGFDAFFVTEHGHTNGFPHFSSGTLLSTVFPGMQVSTKERVSLLILADRQFNGAEFRDKTVQEVIDLAHGHGFVVVCPHWWKWRYFTWDDLYKKGIDGFEIYNAGYRNFSDEERNQLIAFCRERNLLMLGNTDWHGWGSTTDVWTLVPREHSAPGPLIDFLRRHGATRVVVSRRPEIRGTGRYLFEPFVGAWYYVSTITVPQVFGWIGWAAIFLLLRRLSWLDRLGRAMPQAVSACLLALAGYCLVLWAPLLPENMILGRLLAPILATLGVLWLVYGKMRNKKIVSRNSVIPE